MKKLLIIACVTSIIITSGCSAIQDRAYFKVGAGYKFEETTIRYKDGSTNHPISARFELGMEYDNITYGVSHTSQWFSGWPVNNNHEYSHSAIFIDYKFTFKK